MLGVRVYENRHVTFKKEYKRISRRRGTCLRDGDAKEENRSILNDLKINGVDSAEKCITGPKLKVYSGIANNEMAKL